MVIRGAEHRDARIATASLSDRHTIGEAAYMAAYALISINTKPCDVGFSQILRGPHPGAIGPPLFLPEGTETNKTEATT